MVPIAGAAPGLYADLTLKCIGLAAGQPDFSVNSDRFRVCHHASNSPERHSPRFTQALVGAMLIRDTAIARASSPFDRNRRRIVAAAIETLQNSS